MCNDIMHYRATCLWCVCVWGCVCVCVRVFLVVYFVRRLLVCFGECWVENVYATLWAKRVWRCVCTRLCSLRQEESIHRLPDSGTQVLRKAVSTYLVCPHSHYYWVTSGYVDSLHLVDSIYTSLIWGIEPLTLKIDYGKKPSSPRHAVSTISDTGLLLIVMLAVSPTVKPLQCYTLSIILLLGREKNVNTSSAKQYWSIREMLMKNK